MPLKTVLKQFLLDDDGATSVEYALLAALIAAAVLSSQQALSSTVKAMYVNAFGAITSAMQS